MLPKLEKSENLFKLTLKSIEKLANKCYIWRSQDHDHLTH